MNPLLKLAAQAQQQQRPAPAPSHAQTVAAIHRFSAVQSAMKGVMADPQFGKTNVRPKVLDAGSKLLGARILSLPELMNAIKDFPDDPQQQKKFVENIYNTAGQAQQAVLEHYRAAPSPPEGQAPDEWSMDNHNDQIAELMKHYG